VELIEAERLGQHEQVRHGRQERLVLTQRVGVRGADDHRNRGEARVAAKPAQTDDAVVAAQIEVDDDDIGTAFTMRRCETRSRVMPTTRQRSVAQQIHDSLVVDDRYPSAWCSVVKHLHHPPCWRSTSRAGAVCRCRAEWRLSAFNEPASESP
jgi:hypothetical protein